MLAMATGWIHTLLPSDWGVVAGVGFLALLVIAAISHRLASFVLLRGARAVVERSRMEWDEVLLSRRFFRRLAWIAPLLVMQAVAIPLLGDAVWVELVVRVSEALLALTAAAAMSAFLLAVSDVWDQRPEANGKSIKGYLQLVSLLVTLLAMILAVAVLLDRSPWALLTGVGAATAVLLLIFKDTILSLVASVQLSTYDMMKVGDWVSLPQFGADGTVIDLSLHTVKVQNWDKTVSTIPTHKLVDGSIKNWRAMSEGAGRRIKRSLRIDMSSIRFLDATELERLGRVAVLKDYIAEKTAAVAETNASRSADDAVNLRRLTNVGTFRAYVERYLRSLGRLNLDMTFLVRQLEPDEYGLPLEIYCFAATTAWGEYEAVQADIFDHLLAVMPEFGLSPFQHPSGRDLRMRAPGLEPKANA